MARKLTPDEARMLKALLVEQKTAKSNGRLSPGTSPQVYGAGKGFEA